MVKASLVFAYCAIFSILFVQWCISVPFYSPNVAYLFLLAVPSIHRSARCVTAALYLLLVLFLSLLFSISMYFLSALGGSIFVWNLVNVRKHFFFDILWLFLAWPPTQISLLKCPCNANQSLTLHNWHHPLIHNPRAIISIPTIFKQGVMVNQMRNEKPVLNPSNMSNITGRVFDLFISEGISPPSGNSATSGSRQILLANREN